MDTVWFGPQGPMEKPSWFARLCTRVRDHWKTVVTAVVGVVVAIGIAVFVRKMTRPVTAPVQPVKPTPLPDPTPVLAPIAEARMALEQVDAKTRDGAARAAAETQGGHDAIDAARSFDDVDVVLFGNKPPVAGGGPAAATDRGADDARWIDMPRGHDGPEMPHAR